MVATSLLEQRVERLAEALVKSSAVFRSLQIRIRRGVLLLVRAVVLQRRDGAYLPLQIKTKVS